MVILEYNHMNNLDLAKEAIKANPILTTQPNPQANTVTVTIASGYKGAAPRVSVIINNKRFIIELDYLEAKIAELIISKGYSAALAPRQHYPRITINP